MARRKSRTRSRRPASIGSNQLSKRCTAVSVSDCGRQGVVLLLVMAWSPPAYQRRNRLLDQAGDYAAFNFQPLPLRHLPGYAEGQIIKHSEWDGNDGRATGRPLPDVQIS